MAKSELKEIVRQVDHEVILTLTLDEAAAIMRASFYVDGDPIMRTSFYVGGDPNDSWRKHMDDIRKALNESIMVLEGEINKEITMRGIHAMGGIVGIAKIPRSE